MIADLHAHTIFSDGLLTPEEIVDLAVEKNLDTLAITDHDTVSGIDRAINRSNLYKNFFIIPGIELSCIYDDEEIHILGYFINYKSSCVKKITKKLQDERIIRGKKIILKLNEFGMNIKLSDVEKFAKGKIIGRPHIARTLIEKGYVKNMEEAFSMFLNKNKPAYVERYKLSLKDAIDLIHSIGGIAIIAHSGLINNKEAIYYCIKNGIDGIEVTHSKHSLEQVSYLINIANKYSLIKTAGSDCHGELIDGEYLLGKYYVDIDNIPEFKRRVEIDNL